MSSNQLVYVSLDNGDVAGFLNDTCICSLDSEDKGYSHFSVADVMENISSALGVKVQYINMPTPTDSDWNWSDVAELLPIECSSN